MVGEGTGCREAFRLLSWLGGECLFHLVFIFSVYNFACSPDGKEKNVPSFLWGRLGFSCLYLWIKNSASNVSIPVDNANREQLKITSREGEASLFG